MGGLDALQTASIIAAAPFVLIMMGLCASLWRSLLDELGEAPAVRTSVKRHAPEIAPVAMTAEERATAASSA
jgi:choline-glycine betaine transporter